jgi:hypothetical protein
MPLIFKLVGYTADGKYCQIRQDLQGAINLNYIHGEFNKMGLSMGCLDRIKFITDSDNIKSNEKTYLITKDEDRIIFVFTPDMTLRSILKDIFDKYGSEIPSMAQSQNSAPESASEVSASDHTITKPLTTIQSIEPTITPEIIQSMNAKTIKLFEDTDFCNLISIYLKRPELFTTLSRYIIHGNVMEIDSLKNSTEPSDEDILRYKELLPHIKLDVSDDIKLKYLVKYQGHLNLTIRAILNDMMSNKIDK